MSVKESEAVAKRVVTHELRLTDRQLEILESLIYQKRKNISEIKEYLYEENESKLKWKSDEDKVINKAINSMDSLIEMINKCRGIEMIIDLGYGELGEDEIINKL